MKNILALDNGIRVDSFGKMTIVSTDAIKIVFDGNGNFVSMENTSAFPMCNPEEQKKINSSKNLERVVCDELVRLGVPKNFKGYTYLREAILLAYYDPTYLKAMISRLYTDIAKKCDATPQSVERGIRHAIETACSRCDVEVLKTTFGKSYDQKKGKVVNSEFLSYRF